MNTTDYLVEMKLTPVANLPAPAEAALFTERFVLPTLESFQRLSEAGEIVAGGPQLGGMSFIFVVRTAKTDRVEEILNSLPLWNRAQTTVVPLGSFEQRQHNVRQRLAAIKAAAG